MNKPLNKRAQFPELDLRIAGDGKFTIPDSITTPYAFVLFYRGHW